MAKEALQSNTTTKVALESNTYTKVAKPRTGKERGQMGIGVFGRARFGQSTGFQLTKEPLSSKINS